MAKKERTVMVQLSLMSLSEIEPLLRTILRDLSPTSDTVETAICDAYGIISGSKPPPEILAAALNAAKHRAERDIADLFVRMLKVESAARGYRPKGLKKSGMTH
jgi:hypothetical protein